MQISVSYNGGKLDVSLNDTSYFKGRIRKKFWQDTWLLVDNSKEVLAKYTVYSRYFAYDFNVNIFIANELFSVLNYKYKRPHFAFEHSGEKFLVVFHKRNQVSFFRDEHQFAQMKKKTVSSWSGQEFLIIADDDTDVALLMLVIYAILITKYNETDEDSDFTIDLGSFEQELLPYNKMWRPKILGS